jgi:hypothetical protein
MNAVTPDKVDLPDLADRPFLHEQGQSICRGFVSRLSISDDYWTLDIRDVEFLNKSKGTWQFDRETDTYGGTVAANTVEVAPDGFVCIQGYAMVVHIAPLTENPWQNINWPELDAWPGGPMDTSGLTKKQLKKLKKKFQ